MAYARVGNFLRQSRQPSQALQNWRKHIACRDRVKRQAKLHITADDRLPPRELERQRNLPVVDSEHPLDADN